MQISGEVNDIILKGYELAKGNKDEFVTAETFIIWNYICRKIYKCIIKIKW